MKLPYIRYIESLIISREPLENVQGKVGHLGVELPIEAFRMVYNKLKLEQPDYFQPKHPPADPDWLKSLKIEEMYSHLTGFRVHKNMAGVEGALRLSEDPLMYRYITSLALARINDKDIELIVGSKFNPDYSVEDINLFLHYFFDVKSWSVKDKQEYVSKVTDPSLKEIYKDSLKHDKEYIMWKLGGKADLSIEEMMKDMAQDSYYNFKEKSRREPDEAQKWGSLAVRIAEKLERISSSKADSNEMFSEIEFKLKRFSKEQSDDSNGPVHISNIETTQDQEEDK